MEDPFNLRRFVEAQAPIFQQVCSELRQGRKRGHWMWFIFPQIAGLGHSRLASEYAISRVRKPKPISIIRCSDRGCANARA